MRVLRGRAETIEVDRAATRDLLAGAANGRPGIRVWVPHRQVAFGRRDAREEGYGAARSAARARGFTPVERDVGGQAVAYDGETTLAFVHARPLADARRGISDRYDDAVATVESALAAVGAEVRRGEPPESFCPGSHSLQGDGKVCGVAQRVGADAALVSGCVLVRAGGVREVLASVYRALDVPFDPASVGSVAGSGGSPDPERVRETLEAALVDGCEPTVERVG